MSQTRRKQSHFSSQADLMLAEVAAVFKVLPSHDVSTPQTVFLLRSYDAFSISIM